jgi:hypothetical protein
MVQRRLAGNTAERTSGTGTHQPNLLAGMLFDHDGNRMTPSYAIKKGVRYRYYVSRPLITQDQRESATALRIPAGEIEHLVTSRVRQWLLDPGGIYKATQLPGLSAQRRRRVFHHVFDRPRAVQRASTRNRHQDRRDRDRERD